ncbi:MAG: DNA repair protein RecN [bacterium]
MLSEIHIKNFNIAESVRVEFGRGFHVLSGETGAGKSILLQAIAFALGERADSETIRAGAEEAVVSLVFETASNRGARELLEGLGLSPSEDGVLYLKRSLNAAGRSRALINDEPVTLKTLQALGEKLVHLVRQHAAHRLLEEDFLLDLLDRFGGHEAALAEYRERWSAWREAAAAWQALNERVAQTRQQEEFLRFQGEELKQAALRLGEEEELESLKARMKHRVALAGYSYELLQSLVEGDDSVSDRLGKARHLAAKAAELDEGLAPLGAPLDEAIAAVDAASRLLGDYSQRLQEDPGELDAVEDRLAAISDLKRKYRLDEAGLIAFAEELAAKLGELENFDQALSSAEARQAGAESALREAAQALHAKRKATAKRLGAKLLQSLKELALPQAQIRYLLEPAKQLSEYREGGADRLSLLVSFNPGEDPRPFEDIVSGGELSRLLLAFYEIVFPAEEIGTFIFDEVDAGVGGKVAELIGRKLEALSAKAQVLCVTHLPQIACHAARHYTVEKSVRGGRTFSEIKLLQKDDREREIARMLAGVEVTPQALKHARELLKNTAA